MKPNILTLPELAFGEEAHPVVFVRLDLNVPLNKGHITDDTRIQSAIPTLKALLERKAKLIICSHLGRPKAYDKELSLAPVGIHLAQLLETEVIFCEDYLKEGFQKIVYDLKPPQVILLENVRFHPEEQMGEPNFAKQLVKHAQFYVNDAFATCHRADASVYEAAYAFPHHKKACGFLLEKELNYLEKIFEHPKAPVTVVFGGAKVSDKIKVISKFTQIANNIIIGGAMAYTFLKYMGVQTGLSRTEDCQSLVKNILNQCEKRNVNLLLPEDHTCAAEFKENALPIQVNTKSIPSHLMGLDIGPLSRLKFARAIENSQLVLWNGPMGVFEWPAYAQGTKAIAQSMLTCPGTTIVGGGDSVAAINQFQFQGFTHVSTGGGASLELLEGKDLPALQALKED